MEGSSFDSSMAVSSAYHINMKVGLQVICSIECLCPNKHLPAMINMQKFVFYKYRIVSNKRFPSNKRPPNLFSNKTR